MRRAPDASHLPSLACCLVRSDILTVCGSFDSCVGVKPRRLAASAG